MLWACLPVCEHPQSEIVCLISAITFVVQPREEMAQGVLTVALGLGLIFSGFSHGHVIIAGGFALLGPLTVVMGTGALSLCAAAGVEGPCCCLLGPVRSHQSVLN